MNDIELTNLWRKIERIMNVPTQGDAKPLIKQLNFEVIMLKSKISDPDAFNKLKSIVSSAESASGSVKDKENWRSYTESDWDTFKRIIKSK